ncbi:MAG TPA: MqnA/MqnD/SBP family protein [Hyphomicrobiaceae bacterium]|nr:MqnA/MqnD/SBP family protein [Hyphomicrobiaceae bacterium]
MKRRTALKLIAAPAILSFANLARAKEKISYLYLLDPCYDAALWAIRNGKVTSDLIDVEATGANIPTLFQATATKQYDVVMSSGISVPAAAKRGLQLRIMSAGLYMAEAGEGGGVWVKKGSPLTEPRQLKGKTLASYALRSVGYMYVREALQREYGLNLALQGGDVGQVEIVAPNLPAALATGRVDAATLIHSQAYRARQSGDFVNICETGKIMIKLHGRMVSAINVSYPEKLAARPKAFAEFHRMFKESVAYALAHRDEVFVAVGKRANIDPKFFDWWFDKTTEIPAVFNEEHAKSVATAWKIAKKYGLIDDVPPIEPYIWRPA